MFNYKKNVSGLSCIFGGRDDGTRSGGGIVGGGYSKKASSLMDTDGLSMMCFEMEVLFGGK